MSLGWWRLSPESSKNDLVHYIALRRNVLDIFGKSLEADEDGKYQTEGLVHDIIFPRKSDSDLTASDDHNLWIIDERLNFTNYVSSDFPLNGGASERPDLAVYDKRIPLPGDNEASNPITIFEFKKPQRGDFVNASSKEDPVQQIVRYLNNIRVGKFKTPTGRKMLVEANTPFYGYVVCDITSKVEEWLLREKNFKVMPDWLGWFQWIENINLYVEVLSWEKVLREAKDRNSIFFHKLGIRPNALTLDKQCPLPAPRNAGGYPLKTAQASLDEAVRRAYGFSSKSRHPLSFTHLELGTERVGEERNSHPVGRRPRICG